LSGVLYVSAEDAISRLSTDGKTFEPIAGTRGQAGFSGDGSAARTAKFTRITALAFDPAGNLYVADANRIRKIDAAGIIQTIAGTGASNNDGDGAAARDATISNVHALYASERAELFLAVPPRIRRIDPKGIIDTIAGLGYGKIGDSGPAMEAEFSPTFGGLTGDDKGNIYLTDSDNSLIRKLTPLATLVFAGMENAATRKPASLAPGALFFARVQDLGAGTPSVVLRDNQGTPWKLEVASSDETKVLFAVPGWVPIAQYKLVIRRPDLREASTLAEVQQFSPGLFSANGYGIGAALGELVRSSPDGETREAVAECPNGPGSCVARPLRPPAEGEDVVLELSATGIRAATPDAVSAQLNDRNLEVLTVRPTDTPGIDQIRLRIPLGVEGELTMKVSVAGRETNPVSVVFQAQ
jgi:uncharacterized protein (TIGR03437 family)